VINRSIFENGDREMARKIRRRVKRRKWTAKDINQLRVFSRKKTPVAEISKKTRRTMGAIRQKAGHLGIRIGHRR